MVMVEDVGGVEVMMLDFGTVDDIPDSILLF